MTLVEDGTTINRRIAPEHEEQKPITISEALTELLQLRDTTLNLLPVLRSVSVDHLHWKEKADPQTGAIVFDPGPQFYRWANTLGLPVFLKQKFFPDSGTTTQERSRIVFDEYFRSHGIVAKVTVPAPGAAFLDYHQGAQLDRIEGAPPWPAESAIALSPEIDFVVRVHAPSASTELNQLVTERVNIYVNTNKVQGQYYHCPPKEGLAGFWGSADRCMDCVNITKGTGYLRKTDTWLKENGIDEGIEGVFVLPEDQPLIHTLLQARIATPSGFTLAS